MPMDMPLVVYSESLIETYLQAAKRLISSEGELKKELENFRRDPNISSETINDLLFFFWLYSHFLCFGIHYTHFI